LAYSCRTEINGFDDLRKSIGEKKERASYVEEKNHW